MKSIFCWVLKIKLRYAHVSSCMLLEWNPWFCNWLDAGPFGVAATGCVCLLYAACHSSDIHPLRLLGTAGYSGVRITGENLVLLLDATCPMALPVPQTAVIIISYRFLPPADSRCSAGGQGTGVGAAARPQHVGGELCGVYPTYPHGYLHYFKSSMGSSST